MFALSRDCFINLSYMEGIPLLVVLFLYVQVLKDEFIKLAFSVCFNINSRLFMPLKA